MRGEGNRSSQTPFSTLLLNLSQLCRSESLSQKGLREIIGLHGFTPNNDPSIESYKFFRSACSNKRVTEGILRYLIKFFPSAVRFADTNGCIPLHRVCQNKNVTLGMVQLLIDAFPESLRRKTKKARYLSICCAGTK
jgi:hypothetical protein